MAQLIGRRLWVLHDPVNLDPCGSLSNNVGSRVTHPSVMVVFVCECYRQKILIPQEKPYITFQCARRKTILVWDDTGASAGGTSKSASVAIESDHFIATDCTFAVLHH